MTDDPQTEDERRTDLLLMLAAALVIMLVGLLSGCHGSSQFIFAPPVCP